MGREGFFFFSFSQRAAASDARGTVAPHVAFDREFQSEQLLWGESFALWRPKSIVSITGNKQQQHIHTHAHTHIHREDYSSHIEQPPW